MLPQEHELKPLVHALGATKLNQHRYIKAYKQILSRIMLLNKIRLYHYENNTLDSQQLDNINKHSNYVQELYALLDINNTIDHAPAWLPEFNKYIRENPGNVVEKQLNYPPKEKAFRDEATVELMRMQNNSRKTYAIQRIHNAMTTAHKNGWFIAFDTLTLADHKIQKFYDDKNCLRDYTRDIGRMILKAEGRKLSETYTDCYQYIMVPEYGTKNGRLHFHIVHLMRTLPLGSKDPNANKPGEQRTSQDLNTLKYKWKYGMSLPLVVRHAHDSYTRMGWLMPLDKKTGKPIQLKPLIAVGHYVAKYINKATDQQTIKKDIGLKQWNKTLMTQLNDLPTHLFKIRMSRGFGMYTPPMTMLPFNEIIQLTQLHWSVAPANKILRENAKNEIKRRLSTLPLAKTTQLMPPVINLLKSLRDSMKAEQTCNPQSFTTLLIPKLTITGISNNTLAWLTTWDLLHDNTKVRPQNSLGSK